MTPAPAFEAGALRQSLDYVVRAEEGRRDGARQLDRVHETGDAQDVAHYGSAPYKTDYVHSSGHPQRSQYEEAVDKIPGTPGSLQLRKVFGEEAFHEAASQHAKKLEILPHYGAAFGAVAPRFHRCGRHV
ncbi:hypothetical protein V5799_004840 [Amblyomma americanum]|uniref:Uncharacterized protein n=1 Tax=Amblyomma americanum TaxID=6943 RepID=A0AAQ4D4Y6_AMBAM